MKDLKIPLVFIAVLGLAGCYYGPPPPPPGPAPVAYGPCCYAYPEYPGYYYGGPTVVVGGGGYGHGWGRWR